MSLFLLLPLALAAPDDGVPTIETRPPVSIHALALPDLGEVLPPDDCCTVRLRVHADGVDHDLKRCPEAARPAVIAALDASSLRVRRRPAEVWLQLAVTEDGQTRGAVLDAVDTGGLPFAGWAAVEPVVGRKVKHVVYPQAAIARLQKPHRCTVRIQVDAQGLATSMRGIDCMAMFYRPIQEALPTFRFDPLRVDGEARPSDFVLAATFVGPGQSLPPGQSSSDRCYATVR